MGKFLSPANSAAGNSFQKRKSCLLVVGSPSGSSMKLARSRGMHRAAARCLALVVSTSPLWAQPLRAQETREKITVEDIDRNFTVRLPKGYDSKQHYPVVVLLHGISQDANDMERLTRFNEQADKAGIITVYPQALHGRWNIGVQPKERQRQAMRRRPGGGYPGGGYPGGGGGGYPGRGGQQRPDSQPTQRRQAPADDLVFFGHMLDDMTSKFSVDSARIYAAGLSDGGFMSLRLGCAMSDRFAAIAAVGAAMPKTMICLPSRPVPLVMINGTSDPIVPHGGGTEHNFSMATLSVENSAKAWAKYDRCSEKPQHGKLPGKGTETKTDTYNGCHQDALVISYNLKGMGNTWPGGEQYEVENAIGKTSPDVNANELIWNFLESRRLPGPVAAQK
jgi:polyhydroxybutyrate depolymerase